MKNISGFDFNNENQFTISPSQLGGRDASVKIQTSFRPQMDNTISIAREISRVGGLLEGRMTKIANHVAALEVDKETNTVLMDEAYVTKLTKLVAAAQKDFTDMLNAAKALG
jgi:hypothetical protein